MDNNVTMFPLSKMYDNPTIYSRGKDVTIPCEELPETLESREEYLRFIEIQKIAIEAAADKHPRYIVRMLANFALSQLKTRQYLNTDGFVEDCTEEEYKNMKHIGKHANA